MKHLQTFISITAILIFMTAFANAQNPLQPCTSVYVEVVTNDLIDDDDIDYVVLTTNASNYDYLQTASYTSEGTYRFDALGAGPGTMTPSLDIDGSTSGLTITSNSYIGPWTAYGGSDIHVSVVISNTHFGREDPIGL